MNWQAVEDVLKFQPAFRFKQAKRAIFVDLIEDWNKVSVFPQVLRSELAQKCSLEIEGQVFSEDSGACKAVLTLNDGKRIETVLMERSNGKIAVCVSCQAGCSVGCVFCATGHSGFQRNLTADEIFQQVLFWQRLLQKEKKGKVTSVVFMGMGEPLLNYQSIKKAILFLNDPETFNLGQRKISLSTVGIIDGIKKFSEENWQINLAFSLHFVNSVKRKIYMPIEKNQPTEKVLAEIRKYIEKNKRKVMIEYALFSGINDSIEEATALAKLLKRELGSLFMVNLIAGNPVKNFLPASFKKMEIFQKELERKNIEVVRRFSFGDKIEGACGQLAGKVTD